MGDAAGEQHHGNEDTDADADREVVGRDGDDDGGEHDPVSLFGIIFSVRGWMLCQSKVAQQTKIMTATSAAIGISETRSPRATTRMSRKTPARKVEIRVRAPEALTLIMVWPIIAQPPMPPVKPVTMFATPWPQASRDLCERVSVTSSTSLAVIRDSSSPTKAMARANGKMACRVSRLTGTLGMNRDGRDSGRSPLSPTVGTAMEAKTVIRVSATMATSGAGTALVSFGRPNTVIRPRATSG